MAGEFSGDHRLGPMCVPGDETPWGVRWMPDDPEPWPGFAAAIEDMAAKADELYVFVHAPATAHPTTSGGRGSYSYWRRADIGNRHCYYERRQETGAWDEAIVTIHVAPVAQSIPDNAMIQRARDAIARITPETRFLTQEEALRELGVTEEEIEEELRRRRDKKE